MIFKKNIQESVGWWHKILPLFTKIQKRLPRQAFHAFLGMTHLIFINRLQQKKQEPSLRARDASVALSFLKIRPFLNTLKKSDLFHTLFIFFKHKKNGVAAIEIALTLPILLILIMGIIEFSIIFSIRSGIENITSNINRMNIGSVLSGTNQKYLETELHRQLVNILPRPQNTTVCINTHKTLQNILNANGFTNCVRYSANRTRNPRFIGLGAFGDYVEIKVTYKHTYLTPLGGLMRTLGNDLTFSSVAYIRREF